MKETLPDFLQNSKKACFAILPLSAGHNPKLDRDIIMDSTCNKDNSHINESPKVLMSESISYNELLFFKLMNAKCL